jgi:thiamine biosynthesis protein ThiS
MKLIINSVESEVNAATVADVVQACGYSGNYFAVALNMCCIHRGAYATTPVNEGDEVENTYANAGGLACGLSLGKFLRPA